MLVCRGVFCVLFPLFGSVGQVRGFCVDKSNLDVFDYVDVYGDVINSNMHDNCESVCGELFGGRRAESVCV